MWLLLALIPVFYISVSNLEVKLLYIELLAALVLACGILDSTFGENLYEAFDNLL